MRLFILLLAFAAFSAAQQPPHAVGMIWAGAPNQPGQTFVMYRAPGLCTGTPVWSKIAEGIVTEAYEDTTVTTGNYCFTVTAIWNGIESVKSNTLQAAVPASPASSLAATSVR